MSARFWTEWRRRSSRWLRRAKPLSAHRKIGDRWLDSLQSAVLRVPSAFVIGEVGYNPNPAHGSACRLETGRIEDFRYDSRTLKAFGGR